MKTKIKTTAYIVHSIAAAVLLLTAQISLASSASWLLSPQDSAWENANNWTAGGPPNGPSDSATFAQSSQPSVGISTSVEVNSIVFSSGSASFHFSISSGVAELIIAGIGVVNNNNVSQSFAAANGGQIIFNNASSAASAHISIRNGGAYPELPGYTIFNDTSSAAGASITNAALDDFGDSPGGETIFNGASTADHASISNEGPPESHAGGGQTIFNDASAAANASIDNGAGGAACCSTGVSALTILNDTSTAGHATITNHGNLYPESLAGATIFNDSSNADSSILVANGGSDPRFGPGGGIFFYGASMGGTARVEFLTMATRTLAATNRV